LLLCAIFFALFISTADAATLSVSPATGVYTAGQTFTAKINVNTNGAPVNAADGTLSFKPSEISVVSVTKGSIFNLWTADPSFSNTNGTITFSGGSPTGYTGSAGTVISITFKAKAAGSPKISFSKGSVLAADGRGTNVLSTMNGGTFTISAQETLPSAEVIVEYVAPSNTPKAPTVQSKTHPDESKWYTQKNAELSWTVGDDVVGVRTLLDTNKTAIPTKVYDEPIRTISLADLAEGIQYFHIQLKNKDGWGKVTHFRLAVDTQKPEKFDVALASGNDLSNPEQTLVFTTTDATSKVVRFVVRVDDKEPYEYVDVQGSSTMKLAALQPGYHTVIVEAFDEASNSIINSLSFTVLAFDKPEFTEYPREINEQVIPVIKGQTRPKSKVLVSITQMGTSISSAYAVKTQEVISDETGVFIFIPDGKLSVGVYELTAVAIDQYGAQSSVSDAVRIAVQQPGYLKVGSFMVSFLSVLIPLCALLAVMVFGAWFLFLRLRLFKRGVKRESKEAELMLSTEFDHLQKEILYQKTTLEDSRKTKKLTKAESALFDTLIHALSVSQRKVQKEIDDVEHLVE
jgi:hypothetical protein